MSPPTGPGAGRPNTDSPAHAGLSLHGRSAAGLSAVALRAADDPAGAPAPGRSQEEEIVQRGHQQQAADHRQEDHQRRLGKREEAATRLFGRGCGGLAPGCVHHLVAIMTQRDPCWRSTGAFPGLVHPHRYERIRFRVRTPFARSPRRAPRASPGGFPAERPRYAARSGRASDAAAGSVSAGPRWRPVRRVPAGGPHCGAGGVRPRRRPPPGGAPPPSCPSPRRAAGPR